MTNTVALLFECRHLSQASDRHASVGTQEVLRSVSGQSVSSLLRVSSSAPSANTVELTPARMRRSAVAINAYAGIPIPPSRLVLPDYNRSMQAPELCFHDCCYYLICVLSVQCLGSVAAFVF